MRALSPPSINGDRPRRLSDRQKQCLTLAARGLTSASIGERLGLSARTVDEHLALACSALNVRTHIQAVALLASLASEEPRGFLP